VPSPRGAVAQLVAHLHGMEGVRGSNPLSSTQVKGRFTVRGTGLFDLLAAANGSNGQASQSPSLRSASRVASDGASV
jgi:hypothetical protein